MKLTEHFHLEEFTRSHTASVHHIQNQPPAAAIQALKKLCKNILEPLRQWTGKPIIINSGFRCEELNRLVGGVTNSQHLSGEAADIRVNSLMEARMWFAWIMDNCDFDQLIWEKNPKGVYWIHVSHKLLSEQNRHEVLYNTDFVNT